jgi:serine/threonine-protein kinase
VSPSDLSVEADPGLTGRVLLGRYRVVRPLARGGMGIVYLARVEGAAGFARPVVVKSVIAAFGAERDGEQLFAREARIVANLQHPGIVAVIDFGKVGESHVMVLEYVHGYHLGQWARYVNETRGAIPVAHAVHAVLCVLDALAFAHAVVRPDGTALGIVHRDISPANVLIDLQGHVKISDFGIARTADDEFRTQQGTFRGTLSFSAPEALQGAVPGPKLDQYAAGVVLYQLLAGKNPFRGAEPTETLTRILTFVPPSLATLRDDVPPAIDAAIARAIDKDPEQRFADVTEFAEALRAGRTWSEREEAETFVRDIRSDFGGEALATKLGLESLAVRDASWREAQSEVPARAVALSSSPPRLRDNPGLAAAGDAHDEFVTRPESPVAKSERVKPAKSSPRVGPIALAIFLLAAAGAGMALVFRAQPEQASRILVIEKQTEPPKEGLTAASAAAALPEQTVPAPVASASASVASAPRRMPAAAPADRGALLARAFQRQEGKIQSCFQQQGASVDGQSGISVRFQIDQAGSVQRAQVTPASVAAAPLGQCILAIARATAFGPQPEPVSFAIPLSARVVRRPASD